MSYVFLIVSLHWLKSTCSTISKDEIAGDRQNMNSKVAAYVMDYLYYYMIVILVFKGDKKATIRIQEQIQRVFP